MNTIHIHCNSNDLERVWDIISSLWFECINKHISGYWKKLPSDGPARRLDRKAIAVMCHSLHTWHTSAVILCLPSASSLLRWSFLVSRCDFEPFWSFQQLIFHRVQNPAWEEFWRHGGKLRAMVISGSWTATKPMCFCDPHLDIILGISTKNTM